MLASRALMLGATLLLSVACMDSTVPLPQEGRPAELAFSIGGFGGISRDLELRGDTIVVRRTPWTWTPGVTPVDSVRVVPSAEAWRTFWIAADRAGVSVWRHDYSAEGIMDGTGWGLRIVADGRRIESTGSNAYPDRSGRERELEMPAEFRGFLTALNGLVGGTEPL